MKYLYRSLIVALVLGFTACTSDDSIDEVALKEEIKEELRQELFDDLLEALLGSIPEEVDPEIVGDWEIASASYENCGEESGPIDVSNMTFDMTFEADGNFSFLQIFEEGESTEVSFAEGLYMASDSQLVFFGLGDENDDDQGIFLMDYEIEEDVLSLFVSEGEGCIRKMNFDRAVES